jgi:hypothetical protein
MTDQQTFSDVRTTRAHANGTGYTVSLDRFAVPADPWNVYWLNKPTDNQLLPTEITAHGVLLTRYQVTRDDNPTWRAEIELGEPDTQGEPVKVVSITLAADSLTSTALPITPLVAACVRVGGVVGVFQDVTGEQSGVRIRTFSVSPPLRSDTGQLFDHSQLHELTGERPRGQRGYRTTDEMLRKVWDAVTRHTAEKEKRRANGLGKPDLTQRQYVAKECGLPETSVQKQITAARKKYGTQKRGKK